MADIFDSVLSKQGTDTLKPNKSGGDVFDKVLTGNQSGDNHTKRYSWTEEEVSEWYDITPSVRSKSKEAIDSSMGNLLAAGVEVPAALASGVVAYFPSSLAGAIAPIFGEDPDEWEQKVADRLTYDPVLKESKDAMKPIHAIMEMAFKGAEIAGSKVEKETGDKNLAYAARKGVEGIIMATIGKVLGKAKKGPKETKPFVDERLTEATKKQNIIDNFPKRERPLEKLAAKEKEMFGEQFKAKENKPSGPVYEPTKGVARAGESRGATQAKTTPVEDVFPKDRAKALSEFDHPKDLTPQQKTLVDWAKDEKWHPKEVKPISKVYEPPLETQRVVSKATGRKFSDMIKDVNTVLGERGSVGKGSLTAEQRAAKLRLKADIDKINSGKQLPRRKVNGVLRPFVWENAANVVKESPELKRRVIPEKGGGGGYVENPLRVFDDLGPEMKELFFWQVKDSVYKVAEDMKNIHVPKIKEMFKGTTTSERARATLYGLSKQKRGEHIVRQMGFDVPELTPKEMKLYNATRKWFDEWHPTLLDVAKRSGTKIGKVDSYIPFMHKESFLSKFGYDSFNSSSAMMDNFYGIHNRTVPYKFAKTRSKSGFMPVELDLNKIVNDYANISTRHQHLSPVISQLKETMRAGGIEKTSPRTNAFLNNWLDFVSNPILKSSFPRPIAKGLMGLNQNAMFAVLSASARSAAIQVSAIRGPLVEAGLRNTLEAVVENIREDVLAAKRTQATRAMQKSKVLLPRTYEALQYDFLNAVKGGSVRELHKMVAKTGMKPLSLLDMETAKVTWYASFKKATKEMKMQEKQAIRYADDQVIRTQASGAPEDVAPIMRTVEGKTIGFLQTFAINEYQWLKKDILGIGKNMPKSERLKKLSKFIIATSIINSFFEDVLGINSPFPAPIHAYRDAIEYGDDELEAAKAVGWEMAGALPFLSALRYNTVPIGTPGLIGKQIIEGRPIELAGTVLGIPGTSQVKKSIRTKKQGGDVFDIVLGKYIRKKKKKKKKRKSIGGGMGAF